MPDLRRPPVFLLVLTPLLAAQQPAPAPQEHQPVELPEVVVTASAVEEDPLEAPFSVDTLAADLLRGPVRTLPEALRGQPSVSVQKTAYGQSSPYIRGFTGYRTLLLVDGIRLNHAAMRSGPNQYWSTVDPYTVERLELVRGPSSVLYGSDAVGGTVNAVTRRAPLGAEDSGLGWDGALFTRYASAEDSWTGRGEFALHDGDDWGLLLGGTLRDFNDLEGGRDTGIQPATGYEERNADVRFDRYLDNDVTLTLAAQTVRQVDVPRTHKTIFAIPYAGTVAGSELRREQDQVRDLVYGRVSWEGGGGFLDAGEITLSVQRHDEERDRLRTGGKRDLSGFSVNDLGLLARFRTPMGAGRWSWGFEAHQQYVQSWRRDYKNGVLDKVRVQGPVGDQGSYTTVEAYAQYEQDLGDFTVVPGARLTRVSYAADRVQNPGPGPAVIALDDEFLALVGSLRGLWRPGGQEDWTVYAGLSQGFRAPTLSDVTSFDATSAVEFPTPGLDPERFLQAEVGTKGRTGAWDWQVSLWRTWARNMIVQSPTGTFSGGVPVVVKSNSGDGWLHGAELDLTWHLAPAWSTWVSGTWMDGEVDQRDAATNQTVRAPVSRLMPTQVVLGGRWQPPDSPFWVEGWVWVVDNQDQLALRDETDTTRIPPGGTPGYTIAGVTGGWQATEDLRLTLSVENVTDKDYRVHGSGLNGPGRNVILGAELRF